LSAAFLLVMSLLVLGFMMQKAGGLGPLLDAPSRLPLNSAGIHFFFWRCLGW